VARVDVYTTPSCPFCVRAKRLLQARGIPYREIDVADAPELRADLIRRTGRRTVPQIFIDGDPIGGFEELAALDASTRLADLTGGSDDGDDVA
jgi:glutaredoxin 3